jgi:hypothetical protein
VAALLGGCSSTSTRVPALTPLMNGPYTAGTLILGESSIAGMPQPFQQGGLPVSISQVPPSVKAAVYYPTVTSNANTLPIAQNGPFPVLLYAHAFRGGQSALVGSHPAARDFTSVATMLQHVTTYGCVCVAPDLSWLLDDDWGIGATTANTFLERAVVLVNYYEYLQSLNGSAFKGQLDLTRLLVVGHSTGAGGAVQAGEILGGFGHHLNALAYGLIAPEFGGGSNVNVHNLLALGGDPNSDSLQDAYPQTAFLAASAPKTLVTIPGANHFGYTDICPANNACNTAGLFDNNGTITRDAQQQTAAAYLAALLRYYVQGDSTVRPYLSGQQQIAGLDALGVSGIQVQQQGFIFPAPPPAALPTLTKHA